ncbi:MAG: paraquat-inducible protein A [Desulfobacterales bacterium]|jgi:paraquat-inducible protein A
MKIHPKFIIACHECDLLHQSQSLPPGGTARCVRCGATLYRHRQNSLDRVLALTAAGLILFIIANVYPFLTFRLEAQIQKTNLITGIIELYNQGMWSVAGVVLLTTIVMPLLQLTGMLFILIPIKLQRRPWKLALLFRTVRGFRPWGMTEVFMIGILVAVVKLVKMASIIPGTALYAFMILIFVLAASAVVLDPHLVWKQLD